MTINPTIVACPQGVWTPLAGGVTTGLISILETQASYKLTFRVAGDPAPLPSDAENTPKMQTLAADIISEDPIDVYCWVVDGQDGKLTVYT